MTSRNQGTNLVGIVIKIRKFPKKSQASSILAGFKGLCYLGHKASVQNLLETSWGRDQRQGQWHSWVLKTSLKYHLFGVASVLCTGLLQWNPVFIDQPQVKCTMTWISWASSQLLRLLMHILMQLHYPKISAFSWSLFDMNDGDLKSTTAPAWQAKQSLERSIESLHSLHRY